LPAASATFSYSPKLKPLPAALAAHATEIVQLRTRKTTYNASHIRQDTDLSEKMLTEGGIVPLRKSRYFAMVCTNYLTGLRVRDRKTQQLIVHGNGLYRNGREVVKLVDSQLANQIGVSTIAITADGRAILVTQSIDAFSSPGLWAPSGSGSVDLVDLKSRRKDPRFTAFIATAMQRELYEESHLKYKEIEWTMVLGYFRWLNKGAKPEYVGVTKLRPTSDELWGRYPRVVETPFVTNLLFDCAVNFDRLGQDPGNLTFLPEAYRSNVSMPLYMCFRALGLGLGRSDDVGARLRDLVGSRAGLTDAPS
jgi:hypothetical protein